jgi:hypothetical protein
MNKAQPQGRTQGRKEKEREREVPSLHTLKETQGHAEVMISLFHWVTGAL